MLGEIFYIQRPYFGWRTFKSFFSPEYLFFGFVTAVFLSLFIYLDYFGIKNELFVKSVTTVSAILGFYLLLVSSRATLFWSGFFIAFFWFYWIGFSFRYYGVSEFIPLMVLFVSLGYGLFFWVVSLFTHPLTRAFLFSFFSYFHPMSFNWFIPELTLVHSYLGIAKWQFGLFLLSLALFASFKRWHKVVAIIPLVLSIEYPPTQKLPLPDIKIMLADSKLDQSVKWDPSYKDRSIENNIAVILEAISEKYDMVVLNESAFALFLNTDIELMQKLQELSKEIVIVTGGLYSDGKNSYNSTYYFDDKKIYIANKVVLVPFGEEIPLPKFIAKWINDTFYDGAEDYKTAKKPTDIKLSVGTFRNAICYEATRDELFVGNPKYMIAISNNAWFTPSIEPVLQKILMEYFSRKYKTVIFHSANMGISTVIH